MYLGSLLSICIFRMIDEIVLHSMLKACDIVLKPCFIFLNKSITSLYAVFLVFTNVLKNRHAICSTEFYVEVLQ